MLLLIIPLQGPPPTGSERSPSFALTPWVRRAAPHHRAQLLGGLFRTLAPRVLTPPPAFEHISACRLTSKDCRADAVGLLKSSKLPTCAPFHAPSRGQAFRPIWFSIDLMVSGAPAPTLKGFTIRIMSHPVYSHTHPPKVVPSRSMCTSRSLWTRCSADTAARHWSMETLHPQVALTLPPATAPAPPPACQPRANGFGQPYA